MIEMTHHVFLLITRDHVACWLHTARPKQHKRNQSREARRSFQYSNYVSKMIARYTSLFLSVSLHAFFYESTLAWSKQSLPSKGASEVQTQLAAGAFLHQPNELLKFSLKPITTHDKDLPRRRFLRNLAMSGTTGLWSLLEKTKNARAIGEGEQRMVFREKPTAPVDALLPAIQQRLLLEAALEASKEANKEKLKSILPPLDDESFKIGTKQDLKVLKQYTPAQVLKGNLARAAMNLFTTNLNYNNLLSKDSPTEAYEVTDPTWKKSYIRSNDGLPDVSKLIGADLDWRYLIRNQVQLKLDDAAAELYADDCSDEELQQCLEEAKRAFDQWLDRVRYGDVREALERALAGQTAKVYDSWAAGFLPPSGVTVKYNAAY
jgi:hypothetical protein